MTWKLSLVTADVMKEERVDAEEEGKESPTKRTWRETGTERERRGWEREVRWSGDEERARLRDEERDPKESLVALGSRRNWLVRKVSSPGIGGVVEVVVVVSRRRMKNAADPPWK